MEPTKISMIVTIVNRGKGEKITALLNAEGVIFNLCMLGHGTADSELLDYLGLGETEKDVILSAVAASHAPVLLQKLKKEMSLDKAGNGIAFTIPVTSVGGPVTLKILCGKCVQEERSV